jgi:hypothetical protein
MALFPGEDWAAASFIATFGGHSPEQEKTTAVKRIEPQNGAVFRVIMG